MDFIYFVDLCEPLVCLNLINTNQIASPSLYHYNTYKTLHPIYTCDADKLLTDLNEVDHGFVSPRFQYIILSNWVKNGLKIGVGVPNPIMYSDSDINRIHRIAKLEIEFEKVRREIAPNSPSRLISIYLAEDNYDGRTMLKNMFPTKKKFHISRVNPKLIITQFKADSKWITEYENTNQKTAIENYWSGIAYDNFPEYEYLIEGQIELLDSEDRQYIKDNCDLKLP